MKTNFYFVVLAAICLMAPVLLGEEPEHKARKVQEEPTKLAPPEQGAGNEDFTQSRKEGGAAEGWGLNRLPLNAAGGQPVPQGSFHHPVQVHR